MRDAESLVDHALDLSQISDEHRVDFCARADVARLENRASGGKSARPRVFRACPAQNEMSRERLATARGSELVEIVM